MRIFDGKRWKDGYLDPHRGAGQVRLRPTRWATVSTIDDLALESGRSVRRVIDYARQLGPVRLARKVASRLSAEESHDRVAACGVAEVLEADDPEMVGGFVVWFATDVPPGAERIVVDERLVRPTAPRTGGFTFVDAPARGLGSELVGWSPFSGVDPGDTGALLEQCERVLSTAVTRAVADWEDSDVAEVAHVSSGPSRRSVTVFGWGHHARTQLAPALPDDWVIDRVHEIDPRMHTDLEATWDTSPVFRERQTPDVVCVAGFHATHGPLAAEALRRGASVVVEKPVVTTAKQLDELMDAWTEPSRLFALYHRRYGVIADALAADLDGPIDMHATVFEIPLPDRHWYRWPSSGGRIVCNGCHWIDQFLWLNPGADVRKMSAETGPRGQILASLTLTNGAYFTLTLTDRGSARRGTREVTEFRTVDRTARVIDGAEYVCEDGEREIRRLQAHPLDALESAYHAVFRAIDAGEPGDSRESIRRTHDAMIRLADLAAGD